MQNQKGTSRRGVLAGIGGAPLIVAGAVGAAQAQPRGGTGGGRGGANQETFRPLAAPSPAPSTPPLALVSRHVQWTSVEEGAEVAKAAGFDAIAWTVRPGAHIEPADVEKGLPAAVAAGKKLGLSTPMVITAIGDIGAPRIESILGTMQALGIQRYRAAAPRYVYDADFAQQYDVFRGKLEALAKLNERFGTTAMFHTHSYANTIGGSGWDLWMAMKDIDPRFMGINYDIGHTTAKGGAGWMDSSRAARRHIKALSVKDFLWRKRTDVSADTWPWQTEFLPPGTGMVNFIDFFKTMYGFGFDGPIETYFEYKVPVLGSDKMMDMLGTNFGQWKLEIPKDVFAGYITRDVAFYRARLKQAGYSA